MKKRRNDVFLILGILVLSGILFIVWFLSTRNQGKQAVIYHEDQIVATLDLNKSQSIHIQGDVSEMTITVKYGYVYVEESGCPNHTCMQMGKKSMGNEVITCLPNKVYIKIIGGSR